MTDPKPTPVIAEAIGDDQALVTWNDRKWTFPASADQVDVTAMQAMEKGHTMTFLEIALGKEQWAKFLRGGRRTTADAVDFMQTIFRDAWGVDLGE